MFVSGTEAISTNQPHIHHLRLKKNSKLPSNADHNPGKKDLHGGESYPTEMDDSEMESDGVRALEVMAANKGW